MATRDPDRTRERIVAAATAEFSERGPAGARVDAIALRARVNKRMLYHYFGGKEELFAEILRRVVEKRQARIEEAPEDLGEFFAYSYAHAAEDIEWLRLIAWEALGMRENGEIRMEQDRRQAFASYVQGIRRRQESGAITGELDPVYLQLMVNALIIYPRIFCQVIRLATGSAPDDPEFEAGWMDFLRRLGQHLAGPTAAMG